MKTGANIEMKLKSGDLLIRKSQEGELTIGFAIPIDFTKEEAEKFLQILNSII